MFVRCADDPGLLPPGRLFVRDARQYAIAAAGLRLLGFEVNSRTRSAANKVVT